MNSFAQQRAGAPPALGWVLLRQFTFRHWRAQPLRALLLLLLLSLGVAVFLSIRLANRAAVASFTNFAEVLSRQVDATITAPAGPMSETVLQNLRLACAAKGSDKTVGLELIPLLETVCAAPRSGDDGRIGARMSFTVLGVDLVALQNYATGQNLDRRWFDQKAGPKEPGAESDTGLGQLLRRKDAVFCSSKLAEREGLKVGSPLVLVVNERTVALEIAGIIPAARTNPSRLPGCW